MEARHLLKKLKDDGWYLGDAEEGCRQYVHRTKPEIVTVVVRYGDPLGPRTEAAILAHAGLQEGGA